MAEVTVMAWGDQWFLRARDGLSGDRSNPIITRSHEGVGRSGRKKTVLRSKISLDSIVL